LHSARGQVEVAAVEHEVVLHGELLVELVGLRDDTDPGADLLALRRRVHVEDPQLAVGTRRDAADHPHRRRLAGTVRPEEPERLAAVHLDVDAVDRGERAEALAACGWGHEGEGARRASDAFARVAAVVDGERLTLVRHAGSGRPLGCASMSIRDGVATLGGMSTLPEARGQGVQTALIRHRLRVAAASGCDLATSVAAPGGISERNLLRHGFERVFTIEHWVRRSNPRSNPASEEEP
jgi:GNAT superfamily N-acetyltransferase